MKKILVCGSRGNFLDYRQSVFNALDEHSDFEIVEGCCKDSADQYAEEYAKEKNIKIHHYPANSGNYLKRNIEMVEASDMIIASWDGMSYGTAHTISQGIKNKKEVVIICLEKKKAQHADLKTFIGGSNDE